MTQIAQLSEAEIDERFHITGARPVAFLLAGFAKEGQQFSVQFAGDVFLTRLLAVQTGDRLIFDCSGSSETNRLLLSAITISLLDVPAEFMCNFPPGV